MQNKLGFSLSDVQCTKIVPIMLALCSMLLSTYYAENYAGIIGASTIIEYKIEFWSDPVQVHTLLF